MKCAVFLDRDGVITQDPPHYADRIDQLAIIPRSAEGIRLLNEYGLPVIVVSNQSGVAGGYYSEEGVGIFMSEMKKQLAKTMAFNDGFYYCPHHPEATVPFYKTECECQKPKPGLLIRGATDFSIVVACSYLVGAKWSDVQAGRAVACRTILVRTGHGTLELQREIRPVDYIADDLYDAVIGYILPSVHSIRDR